MGTKSKVLLLGIAAICGMTLMGGDFSKASMPTVSEPLKIDGVLKENIWKTSKKLNDFFIFKDKAGRKTSDTEVQLAMDSKWLYIGLVCHNSNMKRLAQLGREHDDGRLYKDDSFEIFLTRENPQGRYYQYILNFANIKGETRISKNSGHDSGWNVPWLSAVTSDEKSWTAEIAIPLYLLNSKDGGNVRINFLRNKTEVELDHMGMKFGEKKVHSFWSPVKKSAHELQSFGLIENVKELNAEPPFLPGISKASVSDYKFSKDGISYEVAVETRSFSPEGGEFILAVLEKDRNTGKVREFSEEGFFKTRGKKKITMNIPVKNFGQRSIALRLTDKRTGSVMREMALGNSSSLFSDAFPDRNYYTNEKEARIRCLFALPTEFLKKCSISIFDSKGALLKKMTKISSESTVSLPLESMAIGNEKIKLSLNDDSCRILGEKTVDIVKLEPKPGHEIKTDRFRRIVLKNGKPFFPFGIFGSSEFEPKPEYEKVLAGYSKAGMNTIIRTMKYDELYMKSLKDYMDMAKKHNLMVGIWSRSIMPKQISGKSFDERRKIQRTRYEKLLPLIKETAKNVKSYPNFFLYYTVDEMNLRNSKMRVQVAEWFHDTMKKLDPYHPIQGLFSSSIPRIKKVIDWMDIISFDVYTLPGWTKGAYGDIAHHMAWKTAKLEKRAMAEHKPIFLVPLGGTLTSECSPYILSYKEQMCQSYVAIINGARGLMYFAGGCSYSRQIWDAFSDLGTQLKIISPAILTGAVKQSVDYSPDEFDYSLRKFPKVYAALYKKPEGGYYLLAANAKRYPVDAVFSISGLKESVSVKKMFKDEKTLAAKGNSFSERIEPFGTRCYSIENAGILAEPAQISVKTEGHPELVLPKASLEAKVEKIRQQKNIVANPSYEEQKHPGIPDFHTVWRPIEAGKIGEPGSEWHLDSENPWHGKYSLKLDRTTHPAKTRFRAADMGAYYPPLISKPTPYVFSAYMKGAKGGEKVLFFFIETSSKREKKTFTLTKDWKRYDINVTLCAPEGHWSTCYYIIPSSGDAIWVDGIQMEEGKKATEFTENK